jgi:hypothetical protein
VGPVIRAEWYRSTRSWRFWVTVALLVAVFVYTLLEYANPWVGPSAENRFIPSYWNIYSAAVMMLFGGIEGWWPLFLPLFAVLPAGDSLAVDRRRGVDAVVIARVGWARYLGGKWVGTTLASVAAATMALVITGVGVVSVYPTTLPRLLGWQAPTAVGVKLPPGVFGEQYLPFGLHFFWAHPALYVGGVVLLALWATAALSGMAVAASVWIRNPLLTLAVPLVICWALNFLFYTSNWTPYVYGGQYLIVITQPRPSPFAWSGVALYWAVPVALVAGILGLLAVRGREWPAWTVGR